MKTLRIIAAVLLALSIAGCFGMLSSSHNYRDRDVDAFMQNPNFESLVLIGASLVGLNFIPLIGLAISLALWQKSQKKNALYLIVRKRLAGCLLS